MNYITDRTLKFAKNYDLDCEDEKYIVDTSKDNKSIIKMFKDSRWAYLGSKYNVDRDINNVLNQLKSINKKSFIIVFGLGSGEYLKKLCKILKLENKVLIIEPRVEIIKLFLEHEASKFIEDDRIYLVNIDDNIRNILNVFIDFENLYNMIPVVYPAYDRCFFKEYIEIFDYIKIIKDNLMIEFNTTKAISSGIFYSALNNIPNIANSVSVNSLKNKFMDKSAIVVSAGPSLEKNIDYLNKIQKDFIIICGLRNLEGLLNKGIVPDFVCVLDTMDINYQFIENCSTINIPIVFHESSSYKVISNYKGPKILFLHESSFSKIISKKVDSLYQGGSVAHVCTSFAVYIGCKNVIFTGQDLAYTDDKFHAKSASFGDEQKKLDGNDYFFVEDVFGEKVKCDSVLNLFRERLEDFINFNENVNFINSTEGGANIKGTKVMTLKDSSFIYKNKDFQKIDEIKNIIHYSKDEFDSFKIKNIILKNKKSLKDIKKYIEKNKINIKDFSSYYRNKGKVDITKIMSKLDDLDRFIHKNCNEFILINNLLSPIILDIMYQKKFIVSSEDTEKEKGIKVSDKYKMLYCSIKEGIDITIPLLDEVISKLN
ncbi:motility associated factor glycosyltransferase family protein [Clostridium tyrobutyricum]|uniref:motility associated factor glycosyltransferase family protein n=1 Tax=Clostridium tyrobutyricum TaxID=1519 RepID=UPI002B2089DB|nr:6-hydroxymethylpterin diphosphokinase MptE-like protein [Clostridium tyrobutyricum]MEA5009357.1 6-hydroxymethylpterin diphosphokinase MptE-like protein [Clostridium tyrobutyricum]